MKQKLKYLVIGAGGTGACIAGYLSRAGKDTTLIVRGEHGKAIQEYGLKIIKPDDEWLIPMRAVMEAEYDDKADVIFVCVKGYSLDSIYDLILKAAHETTVVIPILNIYGTGERMAEAMQSETEMRMHILNGCIYIAAAIEAPGVIRQSSGIFRVVYGQLDGKKDNLILQQIEEDLQESSITPVFSEDVRRDTFQKFSFISPFAAVGAYLDTTAGEIQKAGKARDMFVKCIEETRALAEAMGISFTVDIVKENLQIMDNLASVATASMQRDLKKGGESEIDGLIFEVVRLGKKYQVPTPIYEEIQKKFM